MALFCEGQQRLDFAPQGHIGATRVYYKRNPVFHLLGHCGQKQVLRAWVG
jgi:hypothetical protein